MYNPWYRTGWKSLSSDEKDTQMRELARLLPPGFTYAGLSRFARHGQELETGVFERTRSRFVFVPGDQITLGWEASLHKMDEATLTELNESTAEFGVDNLRELLGQQMSPVREAEITPLLVECGLNSLGWTQVSAEEAAEYGGAELQEAIAHLEERSSHSYELYQSFRVERRKDGQGLDYYLFNEDLLLEEFIEEVHSLGYDLLTEDEWEYLFGGGARSLFPWGDSWNYKMKLRHLEELAEDPHQDYVLELPNAFGIQFAGDPYKYELTVPHSEDSKRSEPFIPKGGDGGSLLCGGSGVVMGYLPATATSYRDPFYKELEWEEIMDTMYFRRIVRLESSIAAIQQ